MCGVSAAITIYTIVALRLVCGTIYIYIYKQINEIDGSLIHMCADMAGVL